MFKVGDKVRRKAEHVRTNGWPMGSKVYPILAVDSCNSHLDLGGGYGKHWSQEYFELVEEEIVVEKQVPGVPDGYRLVRIGEVKKGEQYLDGLGGVSTAGPSGLDFSGYAVVELITPPKPKTVTVVINKYLVGDLTGDPQKLRVWYCTPAVVEVEGLPYRLLGVSETLEVEVDV